MNKLIAELQRLYFLPGQQWHSRRQDAAGKVTDLAEGDLSPEVVAKVLAGDAGAGLDLVSAAGMARVMVVSFKRASDWELVANLYRAVLNDLDLPAPAVSVSGRAGYRIWFSLAEPVSVEQAMDFLDALRVKYLYGIPVSCLELHPGADLPASAGKSIVALVPALHNATGKWSAFIDPSMGSMFVVEPGLEMAPNLERQASMLASLKSIKDGAFHRVLDMLRAEAQPDCSADASHEVQTVDVPIQAAALPVLAARSPQPDLLTVGSNYADPKSFLLAVMNDPSASTRQRIKAAKALLPYFPDDELKVR
ncbi:MAG: hypothetical protein Q8S26_17940 [Azonexus sp.]|nr:hypothetical protein [Azonexus sp.]